MYRKWTGGQILNTTVIILPSVTYAVKIKRVLEKMGISAKTVKISSVSGVKSCEYGIRIPSKYYLDAIDTLIKNKVSYSIYNESDKNL